jgi:hypothetical protein
MLMNHANLKNRLAQLAQTFPGLFKFVFGLKYRSEIRKAQSIIIIATPGHVGSSTAFRSLVSADWGTDTRIYDIHSLTEGYNNDSEINSITPRHVEQDVIRDMLTSGEMANKKITVITLVRDPISRALGGKFQNPDVYLKEIQQESLKQDDFAAAAAMVKNDMLSSGFLEETTRWQMNFYLDELKDFYGIDLSQNDVQVDEGFMYAAQGNTQCLVFAMEYMNTQYPSKIKTYLGQDIEIVMANTNEQGTGADFYKYCKKHLQFDAPLVDRLFDYDLLKQLYPAERFQALKDQWTAR